MCTQKQYQEETGKVVNQYLPKPSTLPPTPDPKIHSQVVPDFFSILYLEVRGSFYMKVKS